MNYVFYLNTIIPLDHKGYLLSAIRMSFPDIRGFYSVNHCQLHTTMPGIRYDP